MIDKSGRLTELVNLSHALGDPWLEAAMIAGIALVTATLAGLVPALQAVRLRIAEAIAYE